MVVLAYFIFQENLYFIGMPLIGKKLLSLNLVH